MAGTNPWPTALVFFSLMLCVILSHVTRRYNLYLIPESAAFILLGVVIGGVNYLVSGLDQVLVFDVQLFLFGLLPIIIFEAGYSMNKREFFANLGTISSLAILGTVLSTLVVGYGLYAFEMMGLFTLGGSALVTLLFGSLISATDPVATLAVFSSLRVERTLYSIVFGEAVMNDAVAIALYQTFLQFVESPSFTATDLLKALGLFVAKFIGSFCIAVVVGFATALLLKHVRLQSATLTTACILCIAYVTYAFNEGISLSGIIAIFFLGMLMRHYTFYNMTPEARHSIENLLHSGAYLSESLIYVYIGQSAFGIVHALDGQLIGLSVALILVGRAVHVFPVLSLSNLWRREGQKATGKVQSMVWFAGLRGAIAFALAILLPESIPGRDYLITTTFLIVIITTFLIGSTTVPILKALDIKIGDDPANDDPTPRPRSATFEKSPTGRFQSLDKRILIPFLTLKGVGTNKTAVEETDTSGHSKKSINYSSIDQEEEADDDDDLDGADEDHPQQDDGASSSAANKKAPQSQSQPTPALSARYAKKPAAFARSPSARLYDREHV